MVAAYLTDLERLLSKPRLDRYRTAGNDDIDAAAKYLWNIALSESLMQGLSMLEVGLRNSLHFTLSNAVGTEYWFQAILRPNEMKLVNDVWIALSKRHQHPPTAGKIIAELTFGFWPYLFSKEYHDFWWENKSERLKQVFPFVPSGLPPKQALTPKLIHERTDLCRNLRNRVMHHEPIFSGITRLNLPSAALVDVHQEICELLAWIDPQLSLTLGFVDRFPDVYQNEEVRIRAKLMNHFGMS